MKFKPIHIALAKIGLGIAVILGVVIAVFQIINDYSEQTKNNISTIDNIVKLSEAAATHAAFQVDKKLADETINGLKIYNFVLRGEIVDNFNETLAQFERDPISTQYDWLTKLFSDLKPKYSKRLIDPNTQLHVGSLVVTVHQSSLLSDFYSRSLRSIFYGVLRNILLTLLLLYVFYNMLSKPLREFNERLRKVDMRAPREIEIPDEIVHAENEITQIAYSANSILKSSWQHLDELATARNDSEKATDALRHSERLNVLGQLTGGIAHDLNNILAINQGNIELATAQKNSAKTTKFLKEALEACRLASSLTAQLLAFGQKQTLLPIPIKANDLLDDLEKLIGLAIKKNSKITTKYVVENNIWACSADKAQLENVLLNLCINARDALPNGGQIKVEVENVTLDDAECEEIGEINPGRYVRFSVIDNGIGMSDELAARVFEPYYTTKHEKSGSGLGLATAYGFATQSKGKLALKSEEGVGTTIELYLPFSDEEIEPAHQSAPTSAASAGEMDGKTILIVEDNELLLRVISMQMADIGATVLDATTAEKGLTMMENIDKIDYFLVDYMLAGGMNGLSFSKIVKSKRPDAKILLMSGYAEGSGEINNPESDITMLKKPFRQYELVKAIDSLH